MRILTRYEAIPAYLTKDGSTIRELMHPQQHGNHMQSLAEAVVAPGSRTLLHRHMQSEELYHITAGHGLMLLGNEWFEINTGDTIAIPAGSPHALENNGLSDLVILCCCSPPYSHDDTELLESN